MMTLVDLPAVRPAGTVGTFGVDGSADTAGTAGTGGVDGTFGVDGTGGTFGTGSGGAAHAVGEDRAALARAVLARAEQRTGVRRSSTDREWSDGWATARATPTVERSAAGLPAERHPLVGQPAFGTSTLAVDPAPHPEPAPASVASPLALHGPDLPVAAEVRHLLPGGVLRRGRTVVVTGSRSLLLALVAAASADGAWLAAVGLPELGLVAAAEAGVDLDRLALVPAPGDDAPAAVAALLDGVDVVLVGPRATLLDADRRRLQARARERGAVLVATASWPGAHVVLDARVTGWAGATAGAGWLRRQEVVVERTGRAGTTPGRFEVALPLGARGAAAWSRDAAGATPGGTASVPGRPARPGDPADRRPPGRPDLRLVV